MWLRLRIVIIQQINSRIWWMIDDCYIIKIAKKQVSAVFYSPTELFTEELCMETPCLCNSEGHKHGDREIAKTSVFEFCYWNKNFYLEVQQIEINASSNAKTVYLAKAKAITHLLNYATCNAKVLYYKKEELCRAKTLSTATLLYGLLSGVTKTSEGKIISHFGIRLRHVKTTYQPFERV